ncbi:C-type lectin domain family 12 member A-like, partial [Hypanus sabinus]|uniref:C-type lectin domain family 12 member A-like n=1 Tax=Hypanus sabinus TaxID=79690 RepID=UPI0028C4C7C1
IRQSKVTSDRNYHELNSTLQSELSALNSNLSDLKRRHSDLRHQFTEMETKFRSVNETKDRICELLNSSREQTCSENWIRNKDRCYFISAIDESYDAAKQHCSRFDSRLLEINSNDEANFVYNSVHHGYRTYWIGKCEDRNVESNLLYTVKDRKPTCTLCKLYEWNYKCGDEHYFICENAHIVKSSGPNTDPCGTPLVAVSQPEEDPFIPILCFHPTSRCSTHDTNCPVSSLMSSKFSFRFMFKTCLSQCRNM